MTEGRKNIQMALVTVKAIKKDVLLEFINKRYSMSMDSTQSIIDTIKPMYAKLDLLGSVRSNISVELPYYDRIILNDVSPANTGDKVVVYPEIEDMGEDEKVWLNIHADEEIVEVTSGSIGEVVDKSNQFGISTQYKIDFGNIEGWIGSQYLIHNNRLVEYQSNSDKLDNISGEIAQIENSIRNKYPKILKYRSPDYFYRGLPKATSSDTTDSSGMYSIKVDFGDYFIVSKSSRNTGAETENYYWMVSKRVNNANSDLDLNNSNLGWIYNQDYSISNHEEKRLMDIFNSMITDSKQGYLKKSQLQKMSSLALQSRD